MRRRPSAGGPAVRPSGSGRVRPRAIELSLPLRHPPAPLSSPAAPALSLLCCSFVRPTFLLGGPLAGLACPCPVASRSPRQPGRLAP
eukprot:9394704-Alexandrium_andersonii.AAC.1